MSIEEKVNTMVNNTRTAYYAGRMDAMVSIKDTILIEENGEYDVHDYATAVVGVPPNMDTFWDVYQNYGNRQNYTNAFNGDGWYDSIFTPKYLVKPIGEATGMFNRCRLTVVNEDKVDFSEATILQTVFQNALMLTSVVMDASSATIMNQTFRGSYAIETITINNLNESCTFNAAFHGSSGLVDLQITGIIGQGGFDVSSCVKLTHDSLMNIINVLKVSDTAMTCKLGATNLAKLTDEQKAVATTKGWTLA